jgi:DmsE family decaheme c-type cytochrome
MTRTMRVLVLVLAAAQPAWAAPKKAPAATPAPTARDLKLRAGAAGDVCLECHANFDERLKKPFVHTPVRAKNCIGCHNPHASDHGSLLAADPKAVCVTCHARVIPSTTRSAHRPVAEGRCVECHDPHSANAKFNLLRAGNELCAGCHKALVDAAANAKVKHRPVEGSCTTCHLPHGSAKGPSLLKEDVPALCIGCHKVDKPAFAKQHMNYQVGTARCTSCHNPHGSNNGGILYDTVHPPVAKKLCAMCHEPPGSKAGFKPKQAGVELCRGCHSTRIAAMLERSRTHQPIATGSCLRCHSPHASPSPGLIRGGMVEVCGSCHPDTVKRQALSPTKHDPIQGGKCTKCHDPHSSDNALMLVNSNRIDLCGSCHDWQRHATHPIGTAKNDPRNKNLTLECLSCHRAHGTEYKHMIPYAKTTELCTKCHENLKR